ncbi:gliding motility-associated C-terminal domain-containing protein [Maribacter aquivivus]|uniref:Gliding motility-associated C-terminal domain-containing protein n=1 Tax=Maribacter aquivivus TaxID=228958 RepID=A0A1M6TM65_9FLAO|nr:T9SS type B sorting domain-containing protein [Maribacter aquivivus]SHK57888.1 gliding motility-associated C-terminal domain-containing protein [Maribacter aquivivus]
MLPKQQRYALYVLLLIVISVIGTTALANSKVTTLYEEVAHVIEKAVSVSTKNTSTLEKKAPVARKSNLATSAMFTTLIVGADATETCNDNGFTIARFNLCGDFDDRIISLFGGPHSSVSWQVLGGSCSANVNTECPNTTASCYSTISSGQTFNLDASSVPATSGAEYRVLVDGQPYYFKVKKSTITQTYVKQDYICGVDGRIQITNLSSAYEFSINGGTSWQGAIFSNLTPGTYNILARLKNTANTCEYPYEPIVIEEKEIEIAATFTDALCSGDTGSITVTASNVPGPYKYTLLNSSGVAQEFTAYIATNPYTFSAVGFGTYTVQVETQQCTGDPLNGITAPRQDVDTSGNPLTIGAGASALDASTEVNSSFGCSDISSVDITLNTTGGSAPYTFTVNGGPVQPSFGDAATDSGTTTFTVTTAGTYDFVITDSNGCIINASSDVENLLPPDVTVAGIDGTCSNGGAKLEFTINNGRGYNISYRESASDAWVSTPQISVAAGTYNDIEVRYQQGAFECTLDLPSVTVDTVGSLTGSATKVADVTCTGAGTTGGQIDFVGPFSGGSGSGYVFSIDGVNFSAITSYTDLAAGTYTPIIKDAGGCRLDLTAIEILDVDPPTNLDFAQSNVSCAAGTSDVQLTPTSNAAINRYEIISPAYFDNGNNDTFTGLNTSQAYIFQITDVNGCSYTEGFRPIVISSIRVRVKSGGDLRVCNGETDGTGTFIIDGFANNYTYDINGGLFTGGPQSTSEVVLPSSGVGTYTITVTDTDTGCTDTTSFDIQDAPVLDLSTSTVTAMSCANGNLGAVRADAIGGWGTFRYTLTQPVGPQIGPKSGRTFSNLSAAGTYTLTVEDAEGCTDTFSFDLNPIDAPIIALDGPSSDFCFVAGTGATVAVTSTAGTAAIGSHQYRINGGTLQPTPNFAGLSPGNYTIEVVDGNDCSDSLSVTIAPQLRVNTSIVAEIPCGGADGRIEVSVNGGYTSGVGAKQYEVSSDGGATFGTAIPLTTNTFDYDTNVPGDYVFRITDNNTTSSGCVAQSVAITLNPPQNIAAAAYTTRPVSCSSTNNGSVTIIPDATSGVPPYEVNFNGMGWASETVYSNLTVGTYSYLVRDARGCETPADTFDITLDGTPPPATTVSEVQAVCGGSGPVSGGINIDAVTDGTPDYTFIIEDNTGVEITRVENQSAFPIQILDAGLVTGDYTVITIDANGCTDIDTVSITSNEVVITPIPPPAPANCDDTAFTYAVTVSGGSGSYQIRLIDQPGFYNLNDTPTVNDHTFSNTADGIQYGVAYTVVVLDVVTNCTYEQEIPPVDAPSTLDVTATSTPGACDVNRNGEIAYEIIGYTIGDALRIELIDNSDGSSIILENSVTTSALPYTGTYAELPGSYQILVENLTDTCTDAASVIILQNLPDIDILQEVPANCNAFGQVTVQGRGGSGGPYEFAFMDTGVAPSGWTTDTTFSAADGTYDVYVRDASGCTSFDIATIISLDPDLPVPTFAVVNQCDPTSTAFDITVRVPSSVNTPRFTLGGDEQLPTVVGAFWEYTYIVSSPGDYVVDVVDANGCTSEGIATVYDFLSATGRFSTDSTCNDADGIITISTTGGSGDFTYELTGTDYNASAVGLITQTNDPIFTGLTPGTYEVRIIDRVVNDGAGFCETTVSNIILNQAAQPLIVSEEAIDISCRDENDGSIEIVVGPANALVPFTSQDTPITYILNDVSSGTTEVTRNNTGAFSSLPAGDYQVQVVTARNCEVLSAVHTITNPDAFSITASAADFACEPGANRYSSTIITVNVVDAGTVGSGYQYSITGFENYQTLNTFEIIDNGSAQNITVYAIDGNGCQTTFDVPTINPPTDVVPTIVEVDILNCRDDERVRIEVAGTTDFTVNTVSVTAVAPVTNTAGNNYVDVYLPDVGDYLFEIVDNTVGCTYPMPVHTVNTPIAPTVLISEAKPVSCAVPGNDGALFITVSDYVGVFDYIVYEATDDTRTTPLASGTFDTNNFPDINGDEARIDNLIGGNLIVDVISIDTPFCSGTSNVTNIRTPNGELQVTAESIGNVSCTNDTGEIIATGTGGWDTTPYEYRLLMSTDGGSTYTTEIAAFSNNNEFTGLSFGFYEVEITDVEGCTNTVEIELEEVPQILAGIREPQTLDCPNGNNAVLEAYDTTTGDAITATAGASGGFAGAGYNYTLLYLSGDDNTAIVSQSGLQNTPTFIGDSGGYISAGWYAIEVSSSFGCSFVTDAYYVDPPPPIQPVLVQIRVPGCGGDGEIRLTVENPDPLFTYEYLRVENGVTIGTYVPMTGNSFNATGVQGITYQYDVRKVNAAGACPAIRSNGITMTDASDLEFLPNSPVDPISCASELDGRIESFASGGVGNNIFTLYIGQPTDGFNLGTATIFRGPQDEGTFEGLPEGTDYWIGVTSGLTCEAVDGPFEIVRPDPIIFDAVPTDVSCNGEEDGSITVSVSAGGVGLIQFAIAPNFNEFFSDSDNPGTYTFDELAAGTYEILIKDDNGCFEKDFITVEEPDELQIINIDTTPELCIGANNGSVVFDVIGGTPFNDVTVNPTPYFEYKIEMIDPVDESGTAVFAPYTGAIIEDLQGGASYVIYVQDANLCAISELFTITIGVDLTAEPQVQYGCEGIFPTSTTTIQLENNNLLPDLMFALDPIDSTDAITANATDQYVWGDLPAGDHIVYIYHENGCTNMVEFSIDGYEPLSLVVDKTGPNEVLATAAGGYGEYEFFFNGQSFGEETTFTTNESGIVNVRVRDARGCELELSVPFEFTGMLEFPNFFTPDGDNLNDIWSPKNRDLFDGVEVRIYDRYGRVVAVLDEVSGWDGTYEGKEVPTGDYWYVVNANSDSLKYVGHFTLYR